MQFIDDVFFTKNKNKVVTNLGQHQNIYKNKTKIQTKTNFF